MNDLGDTGCLPLTPSQTIGPFFSHALPWPDGQHVVPPGTEGAFWLRGRVLDGAGEPVPDALVESWQADPGGHFDHPEDPGWRSNPSRRGGAGETSNPSRRGGAGETSDPGRRGGARGFGRCPTDGGGRWAILTVRPGRVPGPDGWLQAPHVNLSIFARGLLDRVVTRVYLPDDDHVGDPVLDAVEQGRRGTLIAAPAADGYEFDVRLQGEHETVFFDV